MLYRLVRLTWCFRLPTWRTPRTSAVLEINHSRSPGCARWPFCNCCQCSLWSATDRLFTTSGIYVGGGTGTPAERILKAYGVDPRSILLQPTRSVEESIADLSSGRLDAMFVLSRYPVDNVSGALEKGSHLMPLTGDPIERLHREYPFFRPM